VRVKVKAAGVCMSDWHIMIGDWPLPLPMVLGHEAAGEVIDEVGPGVTSVKKGDHVIFSFRSNCGHCAYCSKGRTVLCIGFNDTPRWGMHDGTSRVKLNGEPVNVMARIGTFTEYSVCPAEQVVESAQGPALDACGDHRLLGRDRRRRRDPPRQGRGGLERARGRLRRRRPQRRAGRAPRRRQDDHRLSTCSTTSCRWRPLRRHAHRQCQAPGRDQDGYGDHRRARRRLRLRRHRHRADDVLQIVDSLAPAGHAVIVGIPAFSTRAAVAPISWSTREKTLSGTYYGSIRPTIDFGDARGSLDGSASSTSTT
jgi:S-(hydroxymethyl)glutathione dehydrogenase / alcohol dehydrogenase